MFEQTKDKFDILELWAGHPGQPPESVTIGVYVKYRDVMESSALGECQN